MSTVLLIQDEEVTEDLRKILSREGYQAVTATSDLEIEATVVERGEEIKVILLDWSSRKMEPQRLLAWMSNTERLEHTEVIVHSLHSKPAEIEEAIQGGAFYFLSPTFEPAQLRAILSAARSSRKLKRELAQRIADTEDAFRLLGSGTFYLRTRRQAELLAVQLGSACDDPLMGIGLLELLLNAVEHGNLGITYEEKSTFLAAKQFEEEIDRRLSLPPYCERRVEIRMRRLKRSLRVSIIDQGEGFDFERYMIMTPERMFDSHGRGVLIASNSLELSYVPPGNRVDVTIPLVTPAKG